VGRKSIHIKLGIAV